MENKNPIHIYADSEFGALQCAIVSTGRTLVSPREYDALKEKYGAEYAEEEVKYHPEADDWDTQLLRTQLKGFHEVLKEHGVELIYAHDVPHAWLQLFTRDIGFVIGDTFYLSVMKHGIRTLEQRGIEHLKSRFSKCVELSAGSIEGGDIFVQGGNVFVGMGRQTSREAFQELASHVASQGYECIPVECDESVLHLDCRFNILSENKAVFIPMGITEHGIRTLRKYFQLIEISQEGLRTLATNYLFLSPRKVIASEGNKEVSSILSKEEYEVLSVPFSEPMKLWGGIRCAVFPIRRERLSE